MAAQLVKLADAGVSFGDKWVLKHINLSLSAGEIMAIIGPNGAGKTTLVRVILDLLPLTSGTRYLADKLAIGYMPQRCHIDPIMPINVFQFVQLGMNKSSQKEVDDALALVNIEHLKTKMMQQLSGGELQRVLLARATLRKPKLLVLDEPAQGVDAQGQVELYDTIAHIRDTLGCAVLMISHDLHFVMAKTDKVVCLNQHICCEGHPDSVKENPEFLSLFQRDLSSGLAVYHHHHDHSHDVSGDIQKKD